MKNNTKNNTKNMWIYMAVLFSMAILLILITTLAQSKIVDDNGDLSVLGSFTATSSKKIDHLQTENNNLKADNAQKAQELEDLKTNYAAEQEKTKTLNESLETETKLKQQVAELYKAYSDNNVEKMKELFSTLTKEQIDERIPNLYYRVKNAIGE